MSRHLFRASFLEHIIRQMTNRRGSKRLIPISHCYEMLRSLWSDFSSECISQCVLSSKTSDSSSSSIVQRLQSKAETRFSKALRKYYASFAMPVSEHLSSEAYFCLESVPYVAGISCIAESLRRSAMRSLLFGENKDKESSENSLFPSFESVVSRSKSTVCDEEDVETEDGGLELSLVLNMAAKTIPTEFEIEAFCRCLDGIVENAPSISEADRRYFSTLQTRIRKQFLPQWRVCCSKQSILHRTTHNHFGRNAQRGDQMAHFVHAAHRGQLASPQNRRDHRDLHLPLLLQSHWTRWLTWGSSSETTRSTALQRNAALHRNDTVL